MSNKKTNTSLIIIMSITILSLISIFILGILLIVKITNTNNNKIIYEENISENINEENNEIDNENNDNITEEVSYEDETIFLLKVEDVFTISGRGTVVTGTVEKGTIKLNDEVMIIGLNNKKITTAVTGIEMFKSTNDYATVGDNCALLLKDISRDDVNKGELIIVPDTKTNFNESEISPTKFEADISMYTKEEGGRHTPFFNGYSPMFNFGESDIKGTVSISDGKEMVMPGEKVTATVTLEEDKSINVGAEFKIREGGRVVGTGIVKNIY